MGIIDVREVDEKVFVAVCSPVWETSGDGYKAWGNYIVVDTWRKALKATEENVFVVATEMNMGIRAYFRKSVPR